ncbi:MFS transporter [Siculibacillus lacustris]|uniref:MFS transporter n=1 Tax=Siculibacillus lacustris TaxID=1549641 RepID=A0A4Q9VR38_9HYPH|nr:MFS transporter [Siculibacillus lacustris]TBW38203.1 MFS transporter [Siculibacillus lacustris]
MTQIADTVPEEGFYDTMRRIKAILIGSAGNLVEWYDFYAYASFALYFADSFFPNKDPVAQMLSSAGVFALGFFMRPIGGLLFGHIGDRRGRRTALMLSVFLMCFGSLMIAVTPTFQTIGVAAPALLLLARLLQGLSLGGEYGSSATYLSEMATAKHRGFYSSFQYVTLIGGQLVALIVLLLLQNLILTPDQLKAWGWRIPFLIGALLALVTLWMRRSLPETEHFKRASHTEGERKSTLAALFEHPRAVLIVIGLTAGGTLAFNTYTTYIQKFLKLSTGLTYVQSTLVTAGVLLFALILQPIYGAISDKIGRRPLLLAFGVLSTLCTVPLLTGIQQAKSPLTAFLLIAVAWAILSCYTSINAVVKAELFPASIRATGVGVPYALTVSIFGGSAEYVALWFKNAGMESGFFWYASAVAGCSLIVYFLMPDTKKTSLIDADLIDRKA